ncbi:MAG: hypothetical protein EOP40_06620 [Rubrivivax sp.]|nr:MAG: hypothetical protein EOP40_06620 [Rubrivivax sp.]
MRIDFNGLIDLATAQRTGARLNALIDFQPKSGYAITGYTLTLDMDWPFIQGWSASQVLVSGSYGFYAEDWVPPGQLTLVFEPRTIFEGPTAPRIDIDASTVSASVLECSVDEVWGEWCGPTLEVCS